MLQFSHNNLIKSKKKKKKPISRRISLLKNYSTVYNPPKNLLWS